MIGTDAVILFMFPVELPNAGVSVALLPMKIQSGAGWKTVEHIGR